MSTPDNPMDLIRGWLLFQESVEISASASELDIEGKEAVDPAQDPVEDDELPEYYSKDELNAKFETLGTKMDHLSTELGGVKQGIQQRITWGLTAAAIVIGVVMPFLGALFTKLLSGSPAPQAPAYYPPAYYPPPAYYQQYPQQPYPAAPGQPPAQQGH